MQNFPEIHRFVKTEGKCHFLKKYKEKGTAMKSIILVLVSKSFWSKNYFPGDWHFASLGRLSSILHLK